MEHSVKRRLVKNTLGLIQTELALSNEQMLSKKIERKLFTVIDQTTGEAGKLENKRVNILLSDLRGFTAISENVSALGMIEILNRYFLKMSEIIFRYGGTIDKFMGDSIMALFGAPDHHPDDLERSLACAIEMQLAMAEVNDENEKLGVPQLFMGIGINTGLVVAGRLGSELHSEYTVIGDEVNLASRVEAHSLRGQILISESTYKMAESFVEVGVCNEVHVKGKQDAVKMYELLAVSKPELIRVPCREIRRSARVEIDMPLAFRKMSGKSVLPDEYTGTIIDISYGGFFAVSPVVLSQFDEVKISLSLSLMGHENSDVYAKVLRVKEFKGNYECHFEFTYIEANAQQSLKDFVDRMIESL